MFKLFFSGKGDLDASTNFNKNASVLTTFDHVDLGCFTRPRGAQIGLDSKPPPSYPIDSKFIKCNLGFEAIPLEGNSCDLVTAFDFLEHLPKVLWLNKPPNILNLGGIYHSRAIEELDDLVIIKPVIYLFNEIFRILRPGGQFLSVTPSLFGIGKDVGLDALIPIHQDPTHISTWTYNSFSEYFCPKEFTNLDLFQQQLSNGINTCFIANKPGQLCKYLVEGVTHKVGHDGKYLTMVLEKPDVNQLDLWKNLLDHYYEKK